MKQTLMMSFSTAWLFLGAAGLINLEKYQNLYSIWAIIGITIFTINLLLRFLINKEDYQKGLEKVKESYKENIAAYTYGAICNTIWIAIGLVMIAKGFPTPGFLCIISAVLALQYALYLDKVCK